MKDLKAYYMLPAHPAEVYIALTNPYTIQLWTGEEAVMSTPVSYTHLDVYKRQ